MNRRNFLATSSAVLASTALPSLSHAAASAGDYPFKLPELPYKPEALEPHIDALTMNIHHGKHHAAYVANLVKALEAGKIEATDTLVLVKGLPGLPTEYQAAVRNNGGGHVNHSLFWTWMAPAAESGKPDDQLGTALQSTFGSIDDFKKAFGEAATKRFGSGWAWLIVKEDGKLAVTSTPNQDNPYMTGIVPDTDLGTPILGIDVWEHAYYLHYQNKRPDYITAWWNVVNWAKVGKDYAAAVKKS